jgi:hypothetical protein
MVEVQNAQRFSVVSLFRITSTVATPTKPAGLNVFAGAMVWAPSAGLKGTMFKSYSIQPGMRTGSDSMPRTKLE